MKSEKNKSRNIDGFDSAVISVEGVRKVNFSGFCYLGLAGHPEIITAVSRAAEQYGLCNDLGYGLACPVFEELEEQAAAFSGAESAIYFSTGYLFYPMAIEAIRSHVHKAFLQDGIHYSAKLAVDAAGLEISEYSINLSSNQLRELILRELSPGERPVILCDGVTPTRGLSAPIERFLEVALEFDGYLVIDDAHGFGTVGPLGRGSVNPALYKKERLIVGSTMSKAFSTQGGLLFGSKDLIANIRATSRIYNGTTLPAVPVAAAAAESLKIVSNEPIYVNRLQNNASVMKSSLRSLGFQIAESPSPIAALSFGDYRKNCDLRDYLEDRGFIIIVSNYAGSSPEGDVRVSVYSDHEQEQIFDLVQAISESVVYKNWKRELL